MEAYNLYPSNIKRQEQINCIFAIHKRIKSNKKLSSYSSWFVCAAYSSQHWVSSTWNGYEIKNFVHTKPVFGKTVFFLSIKTNTLQKANHPNWNGEIFRPECRLPVDQRIFKIFSIYFIDRMGTRRVNEREKEKESKSKLHQQRATI